MRQGLSGKPCSQTDLTDTCTQIKGCPRYKLPLTDHHYSELSVSMHLYVALFFGMHAHGCVRSARDAWEEGGPPSGTGYQ